ncbi:MAG: 6-bladed beta-propeller, partial [bacterium]|nr:6-bladed beta-propeller [bacterium]
MKRSTGSFIIVLLTGLLLFSSLYAQKIENKDGTRIVHNEKKGKWGNNPAVTLEEAGTIGDFYAEDEDYVFYIPEDIIKDKDGNLYVLDAGNFRVQKFNSKGQFLLSFGNEGQGPGEFRLPSDMDIDEDGNLHVTDMANSRIEIFSPEGRSQKSKRLEDRFTEFVIVGNDRYLTSFSSSFFSTDDEDDENKKELDPLYKIRDLEGNEYGTLGIMKFVIDDNTTAGANSSHAAVDKDGNVYLSFENMNRIEKYSQDGKLLLKIDRPINFKEKIEKTIVERFGESISIQSGDRNKISQGIAVDDKGRIWNITYRRQEKEEEEVGMSMMISRNEGVSRTVSGNTELRETDMYELEVFDSEGILLGKFPLNHFCDGIK